MMTFAPWRFISLAVILLMTLPIPKTDHERAQLAEALRYRWTLHARPAQLPPDKYNIWLILTGRGWGKTRTAGETVREWVESGKYGRLHFVGRTAADCRDTMIEGESGILAISRPGFRPRYEPSKRRLTWPNGATATMFSAEEPDALRGPQCEAWWADELASWKYLQETWDQLQFGARLGDDVRGVITTTPRPLRFIKELIERQSVHVTRGHTLENKGNLAPSFLDEMLDRYEGTRKGRQELAGEILDDNPNALWKRGDIERTRVHRVPAGIELVRCQVGLDPSTTSAGDEAGVIVAGKGSDGHYYVLADNTVQGSPDVWAKAAISAYHIHKCDRIIYESNQGGEMIPKVLSTVAVVPTRGVHASRGKAIRAEPVVSLYEQGKVHHVGALPLLEDELCQWSPENGVSPNRLDALVWVITGLMKRDPGKMEVC